MHWSFFFIQVMIDTPSNTIFKPASIKSFTWLYGIQMPPAYDGDDKMMWRDLEHNEKLTMLTTLSVTFTKFQHQHSLFGFWAGWTKPAPSNLKKVLPHLIDDIKIAYL